MSEDRTIPERFHFLPDERKVVDAIVRAIRALPARPELTPKQVHFCGVLLHTLQRLPLPTPGVGMTLCLIQPNETGKFWMGVTVDGERFELDKGSTFYSEEVGSDNESQSDFLIYTRGRADAYRLGNLMGWVDMFQWMCEQDAVEVDFDDFGDSAPDWDDEGDPEWWSELPTSQDEEEA